MAHRRHTYEDESFACETLVFGRDGVTLSCFSFPDGDLTLELYSEGWDFGEAERPTTYALQVDRIDPWGIEATRTRNYVVSFFDFDDPAVSPLFREIYQGASLVIRSEDGGVIDRFSLNGSAANLNAHLECRERIAAPGATGDPFRSEVTDPF